MNRLPRSVSCDVSQRPATHHTYQGSIVYGNASSAELRCGCHRLCRHFATSSWGAWPSKVAGNANQLAFVVLACARPLLGPGGAIGEPASPWSEKKPPGAAIHRKQPAAIPLCPPSHAFLAVNGNRSVANAMGRRGFAVAGACSGEHTPLLEYCDALIRHRRPAWPRRQDGHRRQRSVSGHR